MDNRPVNPTSQPLPLGQALRLLFVPRCRTLPPEVLWPQLRLALSLPLVLVGMGLIVAAEFAKVYLSRVAFDNEELTKAFSATGFFRQLSILTLLQQVLAGLMILGGLLAWRRQPSTLGIVRKFYILGYLVPMILVYLAVQPLNLIVTGTIPVYDSFLPGKQVFAIKMTVLFVVLVAETLLIAAHLLARCDQAADIYSADKIVRQELGILYAGTGKDRRVPMAHLKSFGFHVLVLIVLPWLLIFGGWNSAGPDPFKIPGGGGGSTPGQKITAKTQKKKQRKKNYTLRMNSPISFYVPKMEDSVVMTEVDKETEAQYVAGQGGGEGTGSGFGKGSGKGGGWGGGSADGEFRFARLEHGGKDWADGMTSDDGRADQNFIDYIRELSGFKTREPESMAIPALKFYPKGQAPAFVYMTGESISGLTSTDYKTLRQYCLDGGMIFADSGGGSFDRDFRDLMRNVFPDQPLADIPNDDAIFRFGAAAFPDGVPPLWHHGSDRAWGVRAPGGNRLCVFYFPGDLNDAWKSGRGGLTPDKARRAFELGGNVVYYAYTAYSEMYPQNEKK